MPNIQPLEVYAGSNQTLTISGRNAVNGVAVLTGMTVSVYVGRPPNDPENNTAQLTKTATVVSTTLGTFSIAITPTDTQSMEGNYRYQAKTLSSDSSVAVVALGRFRVVPQIQS